MAGGLPSETVIALYDDLISLPYSAVGELTDIESQLMELRQADPADNPTLIALLQSKIMLGKAKDAVNLAEEIWRQGGQIAPEVEATFMDQLIGLGLFDWCQTLLMPKLNMPDPDMDLLYPIMFNCAVGLGDLDLLERVAAYEGAGEDAEILALFVQHQREAELVEHFVEQQQILNRLLRNKQTAYEVLLETERGWPELEVGVFVGGDSVERYQLQVAIDRAQREYYESVNINPLDNFMVTIYDVKEHWPPEGPEAE